MRLHSERFRFAWDALVSQPQRSALTMLGITVGILAVVLLTAVGEGVRRYVLGEFTQFGTNIIAVQPGRATTFGVSGAAIASVRPLTVADANALADLPGVTAVMPVVQGNARIEYGERERRAMVIGVGADMPALWRMQLATGRFLPADDYNSARAFVVLGARVRDELFGSTNPLGARLRIGADRYRVIGVMAAKGQMLGFDLDDTVYVPVGNAMAMFDREGVMEIDLTYREDQASGYMAELVEKRLLARHGQVDFTLVTQDKMLEVLDDILRLLTLGVAALGAISLVVGAFGIATIMTIAISERTSEIGLLRALGATRGDVLGVFLTEAVILSGAGGIAGIGLALVIIEVLVLILPGAPLALVWPFAILAFAISVLIGLAAGVAPALRAARLDPITALRTE